MNIMAWFVILAFWLAAPSYESNPKGTYGMEVRPLPDEHSFISLTKDDPELNKALLLALKGHNYYQECYSLSNNLVVVDFTKPSTKKRFYVFDLAQDSLLYHTYVAHGRNSGLNYASKFSNRPNSHSSSLGFYRTAETYYGKHGLSLRLDGMEAGFNDKARDRAIVVHAAQYANPQFIEQYGRLGRSYGCPALPHADYSEIIEVIKEGTLMLVYYPDPEYLQKSSLEIEN